MDTFSSYAIRTPIEYELFPEYSLKHLQGEGGSYLRYVWRMTNQSYSSMTSTIEWILYGGLLETADVNAAVIEYPAMSIDGVEVYRSTSPFVVTKGNESQIATGTYTVHHDSDDGTGVFYISLSARLDGYQVSNGVEGFHNDIRDIAPYGFLVEGMDFLNVKFPTVRYIAPTLENVNHYTFKVKFFNEDNGAYYGYIQNDYTPEELGNNSYTFEWTDEEMAAICAAMNDVSVAKVTYELLTYMDGDTEASHRDELYYWTSAGANRFEITDANPLINPVIVDTNATTIALTGNSSKLIRYMSNAKVTVNASAQAGASLVTYKVENGLQTFVDTNEVLFEGVEDAIFRFYAQDSREFFTRKNITAPFIPYVPVSCVIHSTIASGDGEVNLGVQGTYFVGNFGATDNSLRVYYRYKKKGDESFNNWTLMEQIVAYEEQNKYEAHHLVENLDYQSIYIFQIHVVDKLTEMYSPETTISTTPIFDWSYSDFNFNVPVSIQGMVIGGDNPILWQGSTPMGASEIIDLYAPVSKQMHGVVLVFSDSDENAWSSHYLAKEMVTFTEGSGQLFLMADGANFATFGAKYLILGNESIQGHSSNTTSGTGASGIVYSNNNYALRYVIGV